MNTKRILVFGSPGSGKKSMLNELCSTDSNKISSDNSSTFKMQQYEPVTKDNVVYQFFQVDGLSKTNYEKLSIIEIVKNVNNFLHDSNQGFNLLIYVTKCGIIHQSAKDEYIMFADHITKQKIPILCVVTNCENDEPMSKWIDENQSIFVTNGMKFDTMIGTCFKKGGRFEQLLKPLREESVQSVWNAILQKSTEKPINFITSIELESDAKFVLNIWNNYCIWIGNQIWTEPFPSSMRLLAKK